MWVSFLAHKEDQISHVFADFLPAPVESTSLIPHCDHVFCGLYGVNNGWATPSADIFGGWFKPNVNLLSRFELGQLKCWTSAVVFCSS
eukprot:9480060-Pyramimonas_sp.AAC.1